MEHRQEDLLNDIMASYGIELDYFTARYIRSHAEKLGSNTSDDQFILSMTEFIESLLKGD